MFTPREKGLWRYSISYLILLSLFFFGSYGLSNWITSLRNDVGIAAFEWERYIPLWPWTIIPYWSIDLFYGLAILLAPNRFELKIVAKRLLTAQCICIIAFLIWPLMFSFQRPILEGHFGLLFDLLMGFDKPFNQAPSLHITLLIILWVFFAKHLNGLLLSLMHIWFALIGLSVLTTWQHHFIDVPFGALTGAICIWLWPENGASLFYRPSFPKQWLWTIIYSIGFIICLCFAVFLKSWWLWLLWPAAALAIVALNYSIVGAKGFQKQDNGHFKLVIYLLLLPYLLMMKLNAKLWTLNQPQFNRITSHLYLGKIPTKNILSTQSFGAVIDLCAELPVSIRNESYTLIPVLDMTTPSIDDCKQAIQAINKALNSGVDVLVCCALGYSRSATIVLAWLLSQRVVSDLDEAIILLKQVRSTIAINQQQMQVLIKWQVIIKNNLI